MVSPLYRVIKGFVGETVTLPALPAACRAAGRFNMSSYRARPACIIDPGQFSPLLACRDRPPNARNATSGQIQAMPNRDRARREYRRRIRLPRLAEYPRPNLASSTWRTTHVPARGKSPLFLTIINPRYSGLMDIEIPFAVFVLFILFQCLRSAQRSETDRPGHAGLPMTPLSAEIRSQAP